MGQVGGDPALQDEEAQANDAVDIAQSHHLPCVAGCAAGCRLAYTCRHVAGSMRHLDVTCFLLEKAMLEGLFKVLAGMKHTRVFPSCAVITHDDHHKSLQDCFGGVAQDPGSSKLTEARRGE